MRKMRPSLRWLWRVAPWMAAVGEITDLLHACRLHWLGAWWSNCSLAQWAYAKSMPADGVSLVHLDCSTGELSWLSGLGGVKWSKPAGHRAEGGA